MPFDDMIKLQEELGVPWSEHFVPKVETLTVLQTLFKDYRYLISYVESNQRAFDYMSVNE